ncbi:HlyD family type I secretion periplasmic adaptor subunit [Mesorhizobium sp. B2-4-14]|uniref:HlyD family type I secretion periplasmic adaptor subunit n=1 Tax=Mesorhizobium sp. B2-4-14 TaxID=2589935 RepID=UPI001127383C|nr:HlyD family type I secretion periplasmic adaptor subunit [Mesorhizobium sp. B2-4-14]TPL10210.1 HlyD family type I secretion periplasmic adaptor subunit [Mesorhizobium sp. B2-4-14]
MRNAALPSAILELAAPPAYPPIRSHVVGGLAVIGLMFCGFGGWAATAPLTSAAVAPGVVKVDSNRKTIQHLEGGIIREILVREGDAVKKGQVLVRLDGLDAGSDRDTIRDQLDALLASEARLTAQRDSLAQIAFPAELLARRGEPNVAEALAGQERIFSDQAEVLKSQVEVWQQRSAQYEAQISALVSQIDATERQIPSLREELDGAQILLKKGFGVKSRALGLERQIAASEGDAGANRARIESLRQQIAEADAQIENVKASQVKTASDDLRDVQTKRFELEKTLAKIGARADRRDIHAPEDGVVMNLRYFTPGGVIAPGGDILDLVPVQDKMVLEVKVQPLDIDVVRPGLPATVRLVAFKQRVTPTVEGILTRVSADALVEERSGATYFSATVEVNADQLKELPNVKLYPGMPVDVSIVTGRRTMLEYLYQPLAESFAHAFRED